MARRYKVEGTNDFLVAAVVLAGLGAWAIKDGWFPSPAVLERHPREVVVAAPTDGVITFLDATGGQSVTTNHVVARFRPAQSAVPADGSSAEPETIELRPPRAGTILQVERARLDSIRQDDPIVVIAPDGNFYLFNKSLAVLSLIGAVVCAVIHRAVK